ncbi:uncharacterized protein LOC111371986 [Olea europaea var. sylvestris]|uniref:uncharacterized protein LOC111371986 n=1 Tax=Olea europaea var. sylvestris TaxID=158386 RepID=UPI000C1D40D6|nr:uncharacterized protein LOC111371986 [Olea europaea var. sylvestris]
MVRNLESIFDVMDCSEEKKLCLATFLLKGVAADWWVAFQSRYREASNITWAIFRDAFFETYYPLSYKNTKQNEFLRLTQGSMTVSEYHTKFVELSKYALVLVNEENDKRKRFEENLRLDIRAMVTGHGHAIFGPLVEAALRVEAALQVGQSQGIQLAIRHANKMSKPLDSELVVMTPVGDLLLASWVYKDCGIRVNDHELKADLILLDIHDFNVILGMDFLSRHCALVDCFCKEVIFRSPENFEIVLTEERRILSSCMISILDAQRMLKKCCHAYLAHVIDTQITKLEIDDISVVRDFPDVFLEDLPGLPPGREIEFCIDLISGTAPISQVHYRMAPKELKELKVQLQYLVDKGFIRPSVSL